MTETNAFKNRINRELISRIADASRAVRPGFDSIRFCRAAERGLATMALKARVDHVARAWRRCLPGDYNDALSVVLGTLGPELDAESGWGEVVFYTWIHAHWVQIFGFDDVDASLDAMVEITQRGSCEFAVRPYLKHYPQKTLTFLKKQLGHKSPHVRRWVSEGTRPRLPWGERLDAFIADPTPNLALIRALRQDPSRYVRTSVANHLGDIAKDHPMLAVAEIEAWMAEGFEGAEWLAGRGLRHLIKQGHPEALKALGFAAGTRAKLRSLRLDKQTVRVGESVTLSFRLEGVGPEKLSIDYAVDHAGAAGKVNRKVFKLAVRNIDKGEILRFEKQHSMKRVTTRKYYPGKQRIVVLVNGRELGRVDFELITRRS